MKIIEVVVDRGVPNGDLTTELTFERCSNGLIRVLDIKQYEEFTACEVKNSQPKRENKMVLILTLISISLTGFTIGWLFGYRRGIGREEL